MSYISKYLLCLVPGCHTGFIPAQEVLSLSSCLKFKEVNKYQHKRALALTARKLVRLVFRLLKDNRLYIPSEG